MMEAVDVPSTSKEEGTIGLTTRRTKRIAGRPPSSTGQQVVLISKDNEEELTLSSGKPRRWETWTSPEQAAFFDAVKQVGKDFDAIVRLMAKRKVKKDKEQIRNYYYNTYKQTKLNAGFADDQPSDNFAFPVPREAKELFVLVNLAEWRKKTSDRKIEPVKFRELVLKGSTSVRLKGKRVPVLIKTPACPALKKFCEEPGKQREKQMPTDVTLELVPMSFGDKAYVLRCEQNPFLRLKLGVVEPLKRYFDYVRNKWIPSDLRLREEYLAGETASMLPDISFYADSSVKMGRVVIQHA
uniref:SANT domain-containing protein n=1 Tax=Plectus sambesii TaxID=2011161 RepID=A0A914V5S1_9BILA